MTMKPDQELSEMLDCILKAGDRIGYDISRFVFGSPFWSSQLHSNFDGIDDIDEFVEFISANIMRCVNHGFTIFIDCVGKRKRMKNGMYFANLLAGFMVYRSLKGLYKANIMHTEYMKWLEVSDFSRCLNQSLNNYTRNRTLDTLIEPDVLLLTGMNCVDIKNAIKAVKYVEPDKGYFLSEKDRSMMIARFFDEVITRRENDKHRTIITVSGSFSTFASQALLGDRLFEMFGVLEGRPNSFEESFIKDNHCCRLSLISNKTRNRKSDIMAICKKIGLILKSAKVECDDLKMKVSNLRNACLKANIDEDEFFAALINNMSNCEILPESGLNNLKMTVSMMSSNPGYLVQLISGS